MPHTMKAVVLTPSNKTASVIDRPRPVRKGNEILVKVHAVALNPVDAVWVTNPVARQPERVVGLDFAGVVVDAPASSGGFPRDPRLKKGARVAGYLQGACSSNDRPGAFAEYVTPEYDLVFVIPDDMSFEEAATIPACGMTAAQSLFFHLGLPAPFWQSRAATGTIKPETPLSAFIYGASTSVGLFTAQLVHLAAGMCDRKIKLIGTASKNKHAMLKAQPYAYDALVDYHDTDWVNQVQAATDGGADFAVDCISEGETVKNTDATLKTTGRFIVVRGGPSGGPWEKDTLQHKPTYTVVFACLGHELEFGDLQHPRDPAARGFGVQFFRYLTNSAIEGRTVVQPNPVRSMPGGLERIVPDGFALLSSGVMASSFAGQGHARKEEYMRPISGEKLVYTIA